MSLFQLLEPNKKLAWTSGQLLALKISVVFFLLLSVPLDWKFYRDIIQMDWSGFNFTVIFEITRYFPRFTGEYASLLDVFILLFIAILAGSIWHLKIKDSYDPNKLYYFVFVLTRYRLAAVLIAYAWLKIFPLLAPYPSLVLLNTPYGDLSAWKIFNLSLGIVPDYQSFLGVWELLAAILLLNRKTASFGAFIAILFLGNVAMSNLAYEGGEFVFAGVLTLFAFFVFAHDLPRYINLLFLREKTYPVSIKAFWNQKAVWPYLLKYAFILVFIGFYGIKVYQGYNNQLGRFPESNPDAILTGVFDVETFILDGDTIPFGFSHEDRWEKVIFEKWNSIGIKAPKFEPHSHSGLERFPVNNSDRTFEAEGIQGWGIYSYTSGGPNNLQLSPKSENKQIIPMEWVIEDFENGKILVKTNDENNKPITAVLSVLDKKYLVEEAFKVSRRSRLSL